MSEFYVYIFEDPDTSLPFYVGKGIGGRMLYHFSTARRKPDSPNRFIRRLSELMLEDRKPNPYKYAEGLTEQAAIDLEEELIAKYGRVDYDEGGILLNVKRRGKTWRHNEDTKSKLSKKATINIKSGKLKTWATSLTKEERAQNVTKGNKSRAKPLYAYSQVDGSFLKEFPPYNETVELLQVKTAHLSLALKDRCFPCGGYLWSHHRLDNLGVTEVEVIERFNRMSKPKNTKAIVQTFPDGTKKIWESMSAVIREMGGHARMIGKIITIGSEWHGCIWSR